MSETLVMARQPIVNYKREILGYEFFYRDNEGGHDFKNPRAATSSVLVNIINQVGVDNSIGDTKAFINISGDILLTDIIYNLPKDHFVFELAADVHIGKKEITNLAEFYKKGYVFALDNARFDQAYLENFSPIFQYIRYVKFDTSQTDIENLDANFDLYKTKILIAQKIEFKEALDAYHDLGFHYFQGYYIADIQVIEHKRLDPKHLGLIRIFNMLNGDYQIEDISKELERHNELTLQLLQYIKSIPKFNMSGSPSIQEIITRVGTTKLRQWILMIIYSHSSQNVDTLKSSYSIIVQNRIDIMLGVLSKLSVTDRKKLEEQTHLVAMLSLLDKVFDVELKKTLKSFDLSEEIEKALLEHSGLLGNLLEIAIAIENGNLATMQQLLQKQNLNVEDIEDVLSKNLDAIKR